MGCVSSNAQSDHSRKYTFGNIEVYVENNFYKSITVRQQLGPHRFRFVIFKDFTYNMYAFYREDFYTETEQHTAIRKYRTIHNKWHRDPDRYYVYNLQTRQTEEHSMYKINFRLLNNKVYTGLYRKGQKLISMFTFLMALHHYIYHENNHNTPLERCTMNSAFDINVMKMVIALL